MSYVEDVASFFIRTARAKLQGAYALNIKGGSVSLPSCLPLGDPLTWADVLSLDEWIRLTEQVIPEGKGKIKVTGGTGCIPPHQEDSDRDVHAGPLPFPVHFEEKGLEALLGERPVKTTPPLEVALICFHAVVCRLGSHWLSRVSERQ